MDIIEIKKNKTNYVQIELREYEGHPYVDVREFYDANGDDILFPDGESINSFKAKIYELGRGLPQPDVFNSCNCR